ncbi:DsbC family protein [Granulosicoccaceae sp. 1_MG-2023]|nr:DsbC family protein [Granulosicoccaceae sp. 1_MG-2023]
MKNLVRAAGALTVSLLAGQAMAAEGDAEKLRAALSEKMPKLEITEIAETPVPGVLELLSGGDIFYLTPDARYMIDGNLLDLENEINLTARRKGSAHMSLINAVGSDKMVVYPAEGETKRVMTVFTDTTCPYCAKLHKELGELRAGGVEVRYLLYPRAGMGSPAYEELQSVWCADDPRAAMDAINHGETIESRQCDNPIAEHIALAREVGLRGTPLVYLDSGDIISGYRPAAQILSILGQTEPLATATTAEEAIAEEAVAEEAVAEEAVAEEAVAEEASE